ncbi:helix-turn-helix domain-containing protein [Phytohabitans houttuyneae]|uniref:Transcriptional regulator n=1 Tax=Phytohabitans houttuyneae TaxID=1076126 RepID=A0A6V8K7R4_9ACTN|nr:helix-turn-helix transcriptional regulator [Phytohabitans houttuyneae]GFJ77767.1 transcriptional regulator [Phytohabitans houttuyneae]
MASPSSSAQQALEALGTRLREIRIDAGLTGRDLGQLAGWHSSKVSRIEHARQTPSTDDITAWCKHCGAVDQAADLIASLRAAEGMYVEWRRMEQSGLRVAQQAVVTLWERTRHFRIYSPRLIPGPVQTRAYIAAMLEGVRARREVPDDVDAAVRVRVEKQRVIHEGAHRFAILLEESVLRHPIGDTETMAGQLGYLLTASALPSVSLGVIPLGADRSGQLAVEGFWLFDEKQVNVELVSGHLTLTQPSEITMYAEVFARLADLAVYGSAARTLITAAINGLSD